LYGTVPGAYKAVRWNSWFYGCVRHTHSLCDPCARGGVFTYNPQRVSRLSQ